MSNLGPEFERFDEPRMLPGQVGWRLQLNFFLLLLALVLMCLAPFVFFSALSSALQRLYLYPAVAVLLLFVSFLGGFINVPMWSVRGKDDEPAQYEMTNVDGVWKPLRVESPGDEKIVALNVGGCVIPLLLVAWQVYRLLDAPTGVLTAIAVIAAINIAVCYVSAGAASQSSSFVPGFVPLLTAVLATWALLGGEAYHEVRPSAAYIGGVLGPLVGGVLLRLPVLIDAPPRGLMILNGATQQIIAIGGLGALDTIFLSGLLAALMA